jgi:hypothetical protein
MRQGGTVHEKKIVEIERHEWQQQGKEMTLRKRKGYMIGGRFIARDLRNEEVQAMTGECDDRIFPSAAFRAALIRHYRRLEVRWMEELGGYGCFLRQSAARISAGELIGIYAGKIEGHGPQYTMGIGASIEVDGTPRGEEPLYTMSRINDWYWEEEQNCELLRGGMVVATRQIRPGEQLTMSYGRGYDWSVQRSQLRARIPGLLEETAIRVGAGRFREELKKIQRRAQDIGESEKGTGMLANIELMLDRFVEGIGEQCMHDVFPGARDEEDVVTWTERVLTSRQWNDHFGFSKLNPWAPIEWSWLDWRQPVQSKRPRACQNIVSYAEGHRHWTALTESTARQSQGLLHKKDKERENEAVLDTVKSGVARFMFYNVGGLEEVQRSDICREMREKELDYVVLIDTRRNWVQLKALQREVRERVGPQFKVYGAATSVEGCGNRVGGQIHIVRLGTVNAVAVRAEDTRGALVVSHFNCGDIGFTMLTVYWPRKNDSDDSMWTELGGVEAIGMMKATAAHYIEEAKEKGRAVIYAGDFNCDRARVGDKHLWQHIKEVQLDQSASDTTAPSWVGGLHRSRIDHVFHGGAGILEAQGRPEQLQLVATDHLPLIIKYTIRGQVIRVSAIKSEIPRDIKRDDSLMKKVIREAVQSAGRQEDAERDIEAVGKATVEAVRKVQARRKLPCWRDGWSPHMMGLQYALRALVRIRRKLKGYNQSKVWTAATYEAGKNRIIRRWRKQLAKLAARHPKDSQGQLGIFICWPVYKWGVVNAAEREELEQNVDKWIKDTKKETQGRLRTEQRLRICAAVKAREELRKEGKLKAVLASMLGEFRKRKQGYTMEQITMEGEIVVDPEIIQGEGTETFRVWFDEEENGFNWQRWQELSEDFTEADASGVPRRVLRAIRKALRAKIEPNDKLNEEPTLKEFKEVMAHLKKDSAPGVSGLSYNMMATWTDETIGRIFEDLRNLWRKGISPQSWKVRWLVPIPKKQDPELADLRPLMLLEALRKAWTTIFVRRIQAFWNKYRVLHPGQHGCVKNKGCETATAEVVHALETAKEFKTEAYLTSWDMRRAFDSVSKSLITFALKRVGVPEALANYLVEMDKGGTTILRSPLALAVQRAGLRVGDLGFEAKRGTGQGDVVSPAIWTAVFDILLTALDDVEEGGLRVRTEWGDVQQVGDVAYADDLVSIQATAASLQTKADLVSGFCILMGLTLATDKFRAFAVNWGNAHRDTATHITIHGPGWVAQKVPLRHDGVFKHLGIIWDMDLSNETQRVQTRTHLRQSLAYVTARRASAEMKILAITKCIIPKIVFTARQMAWTLEEYRAMDQCVSAAYRAATKNLATFPTELLYVSKQLGGLGLPRLSDAVQREKQAMLWRSRRRETSTIGGLMHRAFTMTGQATIPGIRTRLYAEHWLGSCWARSVVEWTQRQGVWLEARGAEADDQEKSIIETAKDRGIKLQEDTVRDMAALGVSMGTEIHEGMLGGALGNLVVDGAICLRAGQTWTTEMDAANGILWEVVAVSHRTAEVIPWIAFSVIAVGTAVRCGEEDMAWGAGVPDGRRGRWRVEDFTNMLAASGARHVLMSPDKHTRMRGRAVNEALVLSCKDATVYAMGEPWRDSGQPWEAGATIYTDGSYTAKGTLMERATGDETRNGYAGIYVDGMQQRRYRLCGGVEHESAYTTELLALTIAKRLARGHDIVTDSQAAIDTVQRYEEGRTAKAAANMLSAASIGAARIVKIRAHIERQETDETKWSPNARGNHRADRTADGDRQGAGGDIVELDDDDIVRHLTDGMEFVWIAQGRVAYDTGKRAEKLQLNQYLAARDEYRAQRGEQPRWSGTTAGLAASMWRGVADCSTGTWARAVRIIWDKHATGTNLLKWGQTQDVPVCDACGCATGQKHVISDCRKIGLAEARKRVRQKFRAKAAEFPRQSRAGEFFSAAVSLLDHAEAHTLWTGVWTPAIREVLPTSFEVTASEYRAIVKVLAILAEGASELYTLAQGKKPRTRQRHHEDQWRRQALLSDFGWGQNKRRDVEEGSQQKEECSGKRINLADKRQYDG